jgi:SPP1 gp7 family putative phage head morphogenesis protein
MLDAVPLWERWQQKIATLIEASDNPSEAASALARWADSAKDDEDIASSIYVASMQADMAGQLFVRTVEVPESAPLRALDDRRPPAFLTMQFQEALDAFMARELMTPEQFRLLSDAAKQRAFTATLLASDAIRKRAFEQLTAALQNGSTLREFAASIRSAETSLGITPSDPAYLETVYRTNVQAAYGAGRYRQITSPAVVAARPFVEYRTAGDSRVRASHRALDRKVFRQDDPSWPQFAPPNGFNCRCSVVVRRARDVDESKVVSAASLSVRPDAGFDAAPTVMLTQ